MLERNSPRAPAPDAAKTHRPPPSLPAPQVEAPVEAQAELPWEGLSHDELRTLARRWLPGDQADDLFQEFVCRRLGDRARRRVNPSYARRALGWIHAELVRRRGRRTQALEQLPVPESIGGGVDLELEREEELALIREVLADMELEGEAGTLLRLRYWEGLSVPDIAHQLQRPLRTVESQVARAKQEARARFLARSGGASRARLRGLGLLLFGSPGPAPTRRVLPWLASKTGVAALVVGAALVTSLAYASRRASGGRSSAERTDVLAAGGMAGAADRPDRAAGSPAGRVPLLPARASSPGSAAPPADPWPPGFTPTATQLRVVEVGCRPVDGFDLWVPAERPPGSHHPGNGPEVLPLAFDGSTTTLHLPPDHRGETFTCFVSSPDHAWTVLRGRVHDVATMTVMLEPACTLELALGGVPIGPGWELFVHVGERRPLLRTALEAGASSLRFERLAPGSCEAEVVDRRVAGFLEAGRHWVVAKDLSCSSRVPLVLAPTRVEPAVLVLDYPGGDLRARVPQEFQFTGVQDSDGWGEVELDVFPLAPPSGVPLTEALTVRAAGANLALVPGSYVLVSRRNGYRSAPFEVPVLGGPPLVFDLPPLVDLSAFAGTLEQGSTWVFVPQDEHRRSLSGIPVRPWNPAGPGPACVPGTYRLVDLADGLVLGQSDSRLVEVRSDGRVHPRGSLPARWTHAAEVRLRLPDGASFSVEALSLSVEPLGPGQAVLGCDVENRADGAQPLPVLGGPSSSGVPTLWFSGPGAVRLGSLELPGFEPLPERIVAIVTPVSTITYDLVPRCP